MKEKEDEIVARMGMAPRVGERRNFHETLTRFLGRSRYVLPSMIADPNKSLTDKARQALGHILRHVLEEECSLSAATNQFRWKITGPNLQSLNRLFDEQRRQIDYWLEQVRARTRVVGLTEAERAAATAAAAARGEPPSLPASRMIGELLERHEKIAQQLRDDVVACGARLGDRATAELLNRLADFHETTAWMLRTVRDNPDTARS